jgi:hypothetical protein
MNIMEVKAYAPSYKLDNVHSTVSGHSFSYVKMEFPPPSE